jgi:hypothetical protein
MCNSYIDGLYKLVEQESQKPQNLQQPPVKSLEQQLIELIRTFNKEQLSRGLHITEFTLRTKGKFADHSHPQLVAEILIKLNWQKRRVYNAAMGINGVRLWFAANAET